MSRRQRRTFTAEQKAEAVRLVQTSGRSAHRVARDLDLSETALRRWVKQAEVDAGQGPPGALTTEQLGELRDLRRENRRLRMERDFLKKSCGLLRQGELVDHELIMSEKANYPVSVMCSAQKVSRSGYYASIGREPSKRARKNAEIVMEIQDVHRASRGTYGSPRMHVELQARDFHVGRHRVARLMRENGITARFKRPFRRTTDSSHSLAVATNHLDRNFTVDGPDKAWVTDLTYVWTEQGWLYLAVVLDLFSRRVIGWSMAEHMRTQLVIRALDMALGQRVPSSDLTHRSDRGSQYASHAYRDALDAQAIQCSMSRKGNCWDNAVAESFFGTLKTELVHRTRWLTRLAARTAIFEYIEVFYNRQRRHSHLDYMNPVEYENLHESALQQAA